MRAYEFMKLDETVILTEAQIVEGFLDSIKRYVGGKINQQITVVNNTTTALAVIYKSVSNPHYLETVTFLLKKAIKDKLKRLPDGVIKRAIMSQFPKERTLRDFLKALCLVAVLNTIINARQLASEEGLDRLKDSLLSLDALLGRAADGMGIFSVLKVLGVANTVLFAMLTFLNKKIIDTVVPDVNQTKGGEGVPTSMDGTIKKVVDNGAVAATASRASLAKV